MKRFSLILFFSMIFLLAACTPQKNIEKITQIQTVEVSHYTVMTMQQPLNYLVDFKEKNTYVVLNPLSNETSNNQEKRKIFGPFKGDVQAFYDSAEKFHFLDWKTNYQNKDIQDGHSYKIKITFTDGTEKLIQGQNAYPEEWSGMEKAFETLTGINILSTQDYL